MDAKKQKPRKGIRLKVKPGDKVCVAKRKGVMRLDVPRDMTVWIEKGKK
jgi:hypothetical protein